MGVQTKSFKRCHKRKVAGKTAVRGAGQRSPATRVLPTHYGYKILALFGTFGLNLATQSVNFNAMSHKARVAHNAQANTAKFGNFTHDLCL